MALVNCPECGRENVSDTADTCPACGYNIKAHYDKIKEMEQAKENELRAKERMEATIERWADEVKLPEKPKHDIGILCIGIFLAVFFLISFWMKFVFGSILFGTFTIVFIILYTTYFNGELRKYQDTLEKVKKIFRAYQLEKARDRWRKQEDANYRPVAPIPSTPRCPHCGSTNVERISTLDRAVSVGMVGLASGKIGKQYKCENCKHMW